MIYAIIAAGGKGRRLPSAVPKQLLLLKGRPVLSWALHTFQREARIDHIVLAYPPGDSDTEQRYREVLEQEKITKASLVSGGEERYHSVQNAFRALVKANESDVVLIHDAARPLLSQMLLRSLLDAASSCDAVIPVIPVVETLKEVSEQKIMRTVPRSNMFLAQTPQVFRYGVLQAAYERVPASPEITDEAILVEKAGYKVKVVEGERRNLKITEPSDLKLAEFYMDQGEE